MVIKNHWIIRCGCSFFVRLWLIFCFWVGSFPFRMLISQQGIHHIFAEVEISIDLRIRHKLGASKMKTAEWNMINRRKQKKKENSRNIWGRKKYSKSSFCECMNRCHILFLFWDSNMYFQSKLLLVCVFFLFSFHFIGDTNDSSCFQCQQGTNNKKIFLVHQTSSVINVHMSLSHRLISNKINRFLILISSEKNNTTEQEQKH